MGIARRWEQGCAVAQEKRSGVSGGTHMRDLFLETVETLDSVLEMVSNLDMIDEVDDDDGKEKKEV